MGERVAARKEQEDEGGNGLLRPLAGLAARAMILGKRVLPLLVGLLVGAGLVKVLAALPMKWGVFIVAGTALTGILMLVGIFTRHLRGGLLFLGVLGLPTFYSISFLFRENVQYPVLANGFPVSITEVFFAPLVVVWLYRLYLDPQARRLHFPTDWAVVAALLLVFNLCSTLFVAREPFFGLSMLFLQAKMYFIMFFLANYLRDEHDLRVIGYAFAAVLILEGLVVMEQRFLGVIFTEENMARSVGIKSKIEGGGGTVFRNAGTLSHPNDMAMYINLCLPLVAFMLTLEQKLVRRLILVAAIGLGMAALISSGSRGGWIGMGVGFAGGVFFWLRKQGKNPFKGMLLMALSVLVLFTLLFFGSKTFHDRVTKGDREAAEVRIPLMEVAMEMIQTHPLQGVGLNHYTREMEPYDRTHYLVASNYNEPVHNTFLLVAAETGLPAMLQLCIFVLLILKGSYRVAVHGEGIASVIGLGMLCSLLSWFIHNQVNHSTIYGDTTLYVLIGTLAAARNLIARQRLFAEGEISPPCVRA